MPSELQQHVERVTTCLHPEVQVKDEPHPCITLSARMAQLHIPGVSVAVIHNGVIEWAAGFGVRQFGGATVNADTLFQAGSINKPVAAMGALHQVQEKKLSLDADVNKELVSWKVPDSPAANGKPVTLRELLTHAAGLTVAESRLQRLVELLSRQSQCRRGHHPRLPFLHNVTLVSTGDQPISRIHLASGLGFAVCSAGDRSGSGARYALLPLRPRFSSRASYAATRCRGPA
jgi:hypothetical protein